MKTSTEQLRRSDEEEPRVIKDMNINQLRKEYRADSIVQVEDTSEIRDMLLSLSVMNWGAGRIFETGWVQLATVPGYVSGTKNMIFVCEEAQVPSDLKTLLFASRPIWTDKEN